MFNNERQIENRKRQKRDERNKHETKAYLHTYESTALKIFITQMKRVIVKQKGNNKTEVKCKMK